MLATCSEQAGWLLCPGSQTYVFYPNENLGGLAIFLHLKDIWISPNSVLVGHGYVQNAGPVCNGHHAPQYNIYRRPNYYDVKHAAVLAHGGGLKP